MTFFQIPLMSIARDLSKNKLKFFTASWIAPKWMKTNEDFLPGTLKENMYQVYVNYYIKFLDAYKANNLTFWAISAANEPVFASDSIATGFGIPLIQINGTMMVRTFFQYLLLFEFEIITEFHFFFSGEITM